MSKELKSWSEILFKWVKSNYFMPKNPDNLESSDLNGFAKFVVSGENGSLLNFLKANYPKYKPIVNENDTIEPSDYMIVYTILLHYLYVRNPNKYFSMYKATISKDEQTCITEFVNLSLRSEEFVAERSQIIELVEKCMTNVRNRSLTRPPNVDKDDENEEPDELECESSSSSKASSSTCEKAECTSKEPSEIESSKESNSTVSLDNETSENEQLEASVDCIDVANEAECTSKEPSEIESSKESNSTVSLDNETSENEQLEASVDCIDVADEAECTSKEPSEIESSKESNSTVSLDNETSENEQLEASVDCIDVADEGNQKLQQSAVNVADSETDESVTKTSTESKDEESAVTSKKPQEISLLSRRERLESLVKDITDSDSSDSTFKSSDNDNQKLTLSFSEDPFDAESSVNSMKANEINRLPRAFRLASVIEDITDSDSSDSTFKSSDEDSPKLIRSGSVKTLTDAECSITSESSENLQIDIKNVSDVESASLFSTENDEEDIETRSYNIKPGHNDETVGELRPTLNVIPEEDEGNISTKSESSRRADSDRTGNKPIKSVMRQAEGPREADASPVCVLEPRVKLPREEILARGGNLNNSMEMPGCPLAQSSMIQCDEIDPSNIELIVEPKNKLKKKTADENDRQTLELKNQLRAYQNMLSLSKTDVNTLKQKLAQQIEENEKLKARPDNITTLQLAQEKSRELEKQLNEMKKCQDLQIADHSTGIINDLKTSLESVQKQLKDHEEALKAVREEKKAIQEEFELIILNSQQKVKNLQEQKDVFECKLTTQKNKAESELSQLQKSQESAKQRMEKAQSEMESQRKELKTLLAEKSALQTEKDAHLNEIDKQRKAIDKLEKDLTTLQQDKDGPQQKMEELQKAADDLKKANDELVKEMAELQVGKDELQNEKDTWLKEKETLNNEMDSQREQLQQKTNDCEQLSTQRAELKTKLQACSARNEKLAKLYDDSKCDLDTLRSEMLGYYNEGVKFQEKLKAMTEQCEQRKQGESKRLAIEVDKVTLEAQKIIDSLNAKLEMAKQEYRDAADEQAELLTRAKEQAGNEIQSVRSRLQHEQQDSQEEINKLRQQLEQLQREFEELSTENKTLLKKLELHHQKYKKIKDKLSKSMTDSNEERVQRKRLCQEESLAKQKLQHDFDQADERAKELQQQLLAATSKIEKLQHEQAAMEAANASAAQQLAEAREQLAVAEQQLPAEIMELQQQLINSKKQFELIDEEAANLKNENQKLRRAKKRKTQVAVEAVELQDELSVLYLELLELTEENKDSEVEEQRNNDEILLKWTELSTENQKQELMNLLQLLKETKIKWQEMIRCDKQSAGIIQGLEAQLQATREELTELKRMPEQPDDDDHLQEQLELLQSRVDQLMAENMGSNSEVQKKSDDIAELKEMHERQISELLSEKKVLECENDVLTKARDKLSIQKAQLLQQRDRMALEKGGILEAKVALERTLTEQRQKLDEKCAQIERLELAIKTIGPVPSPPATPAPPVPVVEPSALEGTLQSFIDSSLSVQLQDIVKAPLHQIKVLMEDQLTTRQQSLLTAQKESKWLERSFESVKKEVQLLHGNLEVSNGILQQQENLIKQLGQQLEQKTQQLLKVEQLNQSLNDSLERMQLDYSQREQQKLEEEKLTAAEYNLKLMEHALDITTEKLKKSQSQMEYVEARNTKLNLEVGALNLDADRTKSRETELRDSLDKANKQVSELQLLIESQSAQIEKLMEEHDKDNDTREMMTNKFNRKYVKQQSVIGALKTGLETLQKDHQTILKQNQELRLQIEHQVPQEMDFKTIIQNANMQQINNLEADQEKKAEKIAQLEEQLRISNITRDEYIGELGKWQNHAAELKTYIENLKQIQTAPQANMKPQIDEQTQTFLSGFHPKPLNGPTFN